MGNVFERPGRWQNPNTRPAGTMREELIQVCDFIQSCPSIGGMLGPNVDVRVRLSASGKGLIIELEPAKGVSGA